MKALRPSRLVSEVGDVILAVDGNEVKNTRELARAIGRTDPESDVELTIWRDGKEIKPDGQSWSLP